MCKVTGVDDGSAAISTAELFDPAIGKFSPAGNMQQTREFHTATFRNDGSVLVVGGDGFTLSPEGAVRAGITPESTAAAELFDPSSSKFTAAGEMSNPRAKHTATLLPDGNVIVIGGALSGNFARPFFLSSAELFQ